MVVASGASLAWTPWTSAAEAKGLAVLLGGLVAALFLVHRAWVHGLRSLRPIGSPALGGLATAAVAWSALAGHWGPSGVGWLAFGSSVGALLFATAAASLGRRAALHVFVHSTSYVALINAACALAQAIARKPIVGLSGNPDWLGLLLCAALPAQLSRTFRALRTKAPWWTRGAHVAVLATHGLATLFAQSRVGWVALVVAACAWAVHRRRREHVSSIRTVRAFLAAPLSPSAFHDAPWLTSLDARLWIARHSLQAFSTSPWVGHGAGGFGAAYLDAQASTLSSMTPAQAARRYSFAGTAHSDALQVLVEQGLIGLALWGGAAFVFARGSWREDSALLPTTATILLLEASVEMPLHQPSIFLLACLMGVCLSGPRNTRAFKPRKLHIAAFFAVGSWALPSSARVFLSSCLVHVSDETVGPEKLTQLETAVRLSPTNVDAALALAQAHADRGHLQRAMDLTHAAAHNTPSVATSLALGNALARLDRWTEASEHYRQALFWDPGSLKGRVNAATAARHLGQLDEAKTHLAAAKSIAPYALTVRDLEEQVLEDEMDAVNPGSSP